MAAGVTDEGNAQLMAGHVPVVEKKIFQQVCRSSRKAEQVRQEGKQKPIHEACKSDEELWMGLDKEIDIAIDMVSIKSFNSIHSVIVTKLGTSSSQNAYWNIK